MPGKSFKIVHKSTLYHGDEASRKMQLAKITQGHRAGYPVDLHYGAINASNGNIYMGSAAVTDPRVLQIRFLPSFGGVLNQSELATTCDKVYKLVTGGAYKATSYSRVDLLKFFIIQANLFAKLAYIDRTLSIYAATKFINLGVSVLQQSMQFNVPSANSNAYAELMSLRTEVANMLNELIMPATFPALDRLISYCQHIYCDDIHEKTQFFYLEPLGFYSALVNGSANNDVEFDKMTNYSGTLYDFLWSLKTQIESFKESAFYNAIVPDVEKAFVSPQAWIHVPLYQVSVSYDPITQDFEAVFDIEVIQMLHNGQFIGLPMSNYLNLYENSNEELVQGHSSWTSGQPSAKDIPGIIMRPIASTSATPAISAMVPIDIKGNTASLLYAGSFLNRVINGEDYPTPEDSLSVILGSHCLVSNVPVRMYDSRLNVITRSTDMLLLDMQVFAYNYNTGYFLPNYVRVLNAGAAYTNYASAGLRDELRKFNCAPILVEFQADLSTNIINSIAYKIIDIDNLIEVPEVTIRDLTMFSIYGLYGLETLRTNGSTPSDNKGSNPKKKKFKNKSKDKNKNKRPDPDSSKTGDDGQDKKSK